MHTHPCKKRGLHPPPPWRLHTSSACAALRLYKPSCSHPSSHSITPTHTRAISKEKEKRRDEAREPTGLPSILVSCTCTLIPSLFPYLSIDSSLSLFLVHAYAPSSSRRPRVFEKTHRRSLPSPPRYPRTESRPVFLGRSLIHSLTAPAWRSRTSWCPSAIQFDPSKAR